MAEATFKLKWDQSGERFYETGTDRGVFYSYKVTNEATGSTPAEYKYTDGEAWNGLTSVTQSPSGAESTPLYADNTKYIELTSAEDFGGTIEAYTYPDGFAKCNGEASLVAGITIGQQERMPFGFSYRTKLGNDVLGDSYGYKIHLVYGAKAAPSEKAYTTVNDSPEAITFSWEFTTTPVAVAGFKPAAHLEIDSSKVDKDKLADFEAKLYGSGSEEATMPLPDEVLAFFKA